jgi:ABC-type multidrug transport system fused ATPase/permease subunit
LPRESVSTSAAPIELKRALTVERLSFRYREDAPWIFKDFSLRINAFSSVAFTGKTGCGKTTLADLVMGFLDPVEGHIRVDGRDIRENLASWRARIGYVPQSIYMLNDSIRRNVAFGIEDEAIDDAGVWRALELAQIADFVKGIPERLDTEIGERGVRLSGGQRQRIGIARALYRNPDMLILDEATSALDSETEQAFVEAIGALQGKLTMIVIAHRLSTVEKCDVILKLGEA